jgi:hypothetical protein
MVDCLTTIGSHPRPISTARNSTSSSSESSLKVSLSSDLEVARCSVMLGQFYPSEKLKLP